MIPERATYPDRQGWVNRPGLPKALHSSEVERRDDEQGRVQAFT